MKVIVIKPGEEPVVTETRDDLESLQKLVGGYVQVVRWVPPFIVLVNEDGLRLQLPVNTMFPDHTLVGNVVIAKRSRSEIVGLTLDECDKVMQRLRDF